MKRDNRGNERTPWRICAEGCVGGGSCERGWKTIKRAAKVNRGCGWKIFKKEKTFISASSEGEIISY